MSLSPPLKRFIVSMLAAGLVAAAAVGSNTTEATEPLTFVLVVASAFAVGAIDYARKNWPALVAAARDGGAELAGGAAVAAALAVLTLFYGGAVDKVGIEEPGAVSRPIAFSPGDDKFDVGDWCRTVATKVYVERQSAEVIGAVRIAWRSDFDYIRWVDNNVDTGATFFFVWGNEPKPPAGKKAGDNDHKQVQVIDADDVACMREVRG